VVKTSFHIIITFISGIYRQMRPMARRTFDTAASCSNKWSMKCKDTSQSYRHQLAMLQKQRLPWLLTNCDWNLAYKSQSCFDKWGWWKISFHL